MKQIVCSILLGGGGGGGVLLYLQCDEDWELPRLSETISSRTLANTLEKASKQWSRAPLFHMDPAK
eukprot:3178164-Amphidinium_carterae.1